VIADRDVTSLRPFGLGSTTAFALRLELPVLVAWFAGVAAAGICFGIIAKVAIGALPESMGNLLDKFGVQGTFLRQYLGVVFLMMAAIVSLLPANQIGAAAEEETTGRLVHLLAQPSRRTPLFAGRMAIAAVAVAVAGVVAGLSTWAGARLQGVDTGLGLTLQAGANVVPTALLVLGIGAVVRTVAPRQASAAVYGVVAWSFIADLVASLVDATRWMEHLSVFHYMALVPADAADPVSVIAMLFVAVALLAVATVLFARRDVSQA
jgi:ABC-2 type transport system permease protein